MNSLMSPQLQYVITFLRAHVDAARDPDRSRGASAIEWAIITAAAATIAIIVGGIILNKVQTAAENTDVSPGLGGGGT